MSGLLLRRGLGIPLFLTVLGFCLFGDCAAFKRSQLLGPALTEMSAVLSDPGTQWMVFLCASIYLLGFVVLRIRLDRTTSQGQRVKSPASGAVFFAGFMVVAASAYAFCYAEAVRSTEALALVGGAMIGQGAGFWESRKQKAESREGTKRLKS